MLVLIPRFPMFIRTPGKSVNVCRKRSVILVIYILSLNLAAITDWRDNVF